MNKIFIAIAVLLVVGSAYASTSCSVGKYTTCTCNGKIEKYLSLSDELKEAMENPKSCCYAHKQQIKTYIQSQQPTNIKRGYTLPVIGTPQVAQPDVLTAEQMAQVQSQYEVPYEEVGIISAEQMAQVQSQYEVPYQQEIEQPLVDNKMIITLFLSVFQPHLTTHLGISNFLSS